MWEETCCLLFSNISFHSRDVQLFKICQLAKWRCHTPNQILINLSLWTCSTFLVLKSLTLLKSSGGHWKRVSCHGNRSFYSQRRVSCRTISLPSINGLHYKLAKIALFIYLIIILGWVYDIVSHLICIFYSFFMFKYPWN